MSKPTEGDGEKGTEALSKITAAIAELRAAGGTLGAKVSAELLQLGVNIEVEGDE